MSDPQQEQRHTPDPERRFGPNPCKHGGYQVLCRECDQEEIDRALIEMQRPDLGAKGA